MQTMVVCYIQFILTWMLPISVAQNRFSKPGNLSFAVLLPVHAYESLDVCDEKLYFHGLGLGYIETIQYTVDKINKDESILPGVNLGFEVWDYCDTAGLAMRSAYHLVDTASESELNAVDNDKCLANGLRNNSSSRPIMAVIGTISSHSTTYVASLLQVMGVPIISPFATSDSLTSPFYTTFFRTVPPDSMQAKAMVSLIEHFNWTYVVILARDDSYGRYGAQAIQRESYKRKTFCIAMIEYVTQAIYNKREYRAIIQKLRLMENVKVIVLWVFREDARGFLAEAEKMKFFNRTFLLSEGMSTLDANVLSRYAVLLEGAIGVKPHNYHDPELLRHLKALTPGDTSKNDIPWWSKFWEQEFHCSSSDSGAASLPKCNASFSLDAGYKKLIDGYTPYTTDAVYAIAHALNAIKNCRAAGASGRGCQPRDVTRQLRNTSFMGKSGWIEFSEDGDPKHTLLDYVNFQRSNTGYRYVTIGEWEEFGVNEMYHLDESLIRWNTDDNSTPISVCEKECAAGFRKVLTTECCWKCFECPLDFTNANPGSPNCTKCPVEQTSNKQKTECVDRQVLKIEWNDGAALLFIAMTTLGLIMTTFVVGVFLKYKHTPAVKGSNLELSLLLLFVISLIFILTFLHLAEPSDALCHVIQPWRYITCTFVVSILFFKTNKLVQAFQTVVPAWCKKYVLAQKRQIVSVLILNCVEIVLAILWLTFDPPYRKRDINTFILITCAPFKTSVGNALRSTVFAYLIFMSLLCTVYAFKARKLPENFNEARYIGFSMYVLLLSWIAYYPVDSTLEGSYINIVACATALLIAYGVLGCMFFPKVFVILRHPEQNTEEVVKASIGRFNLSSKESTVSSTNESTRHSTVAEDLPIVAS